jgi:hypothetical protein
VPTRSACFDHDRRRPGWGDQGRPLRPSRWVWGSGRQCVDRRVLGHSHSRGWWMVDGGNAVASTVFGVALYVAQCWGGLDGKGTIAPGPTLAGNAGRPGWCLWRQCPVAPSSVGGVIS